MAEAEFLSPLPGLFRLFSGFPALTCWARFCRLLRRLARREIRVSFLPSQRLCERQGAPGAFNNGRVEELAAEGDGAFAARDPFRIRGDDLAAIVHFLRRG